MDTISPARERLGLVTLTSYDAGSGDYALRATGVFYQVSGISSGLPTDESCVNALYSAEEPTTSASGTMDAGAALELRVSGLTDSLFRSIVSGIVTYSSDAEGTPFTPGDTLTLDIPGATGGFPAGTMKMRTADPFTADPVGTPTSGQALAVTWSPSPAIGTWMTLSLRYASSDTETEPNRQVFCTFFDDGSAQVQASLADIWGSSPVGTRSVAWARVRLDVLNLDSRTLLAVASSFDQPLLPVP